MRRLPLTRAFVDRVSTFHEAIVAGAFAGAEETKSDYWKWHSAQSQIKFARDSVWIAGNSGFYIPPDRGNLRHRLLSAVQCGYRKFVVAADGWLRFEDPSTLFTGGMAYDAVMSGHDHAGDGEPYAGNPNRFDRRLLNPLFPNSSAVRGDWFLKRRYYADTHILTAAYLYSMFAHFLERRTNVYLEIGAGNGNLASFFHHYAAMRVVIVDLPETILYSCCYLQSVFPKASMVLPNELSASETVPSGNATFTFLTPIQLDRLRGNSVDAVVNVSSMQEMTAAQIEAYCRLSQHVVMDGGLICNLNRVEKFASWIGPASRAFEYPHDSANETLVKEIDRYFRLLQVDSMLMRIDRARKPAREIHGSTTVVA